MSRFFGECVHAAFVVSDFDAAIQRLIDAGVGPVFVMRRIRTAGRFRGERHDPLISAAFAYSGPCQYELLYQHDDTPSAYKEVLDRNPTGGLHHTAYFAPEGFDAAMAAAKAKGTEFEIVQEFIDPEGTAYEIYVEPKGKADPLLAQLMVEGPMEPFFAAMQEIAASWDGSDPIRDALKMIPPEMVPPQEF
jgi:hypothetical protein